MSLYADDSLTALQEIGNNYSSMKQLHTWKTTPPPPPKPPDPSPSHQWFFFCTTINHHDSRQWREAVFDPEFWWFHTELHEWNWGEVNNSFTSLQWVKGHGTFALVTVFVVNCICSRSCDVTTVCVCAQVCEERMKTESERERVCFWKFLRFSPRTAGLWLHIGIFFL